MSDEKKIIIDDDWKQQAAREKEQLAAAVEESVGGSEAGGPMSAGGFAGLVQLLAMQALVGLGGFAGPGGQEIPPNLELAKMHIDMLDLLEQKTKGNLTPDEKAMLDTTLHQLRIAYVESVQAAAPIRPGGAPR
ncbi:MAG: hypothetical protein HBSAPP02_26500 [Phycisphaerae bacterium]|nr:MAG: DUF1844 domain-containing protein [Planctomycetia bacterium]RIK71082.1 MAG: hypothetical protein DCC66_02620 [Planctomycetota bacterium]GJQ27618.1 MAG: hypothetical protein HBSAPP02_26500 [Phycisphaerae bacterium]